MTTIRTTARISWVVEVVVVVVVAVRIGTKVRWFQGQMNVTRYLGYSPINNNSSSTSSDPFDPFSDTHKSPSNDDDDDAGYEEPLLLFAVRRY